MSVQRIIRRALPAIAFVVVAVHPLAAQQSFAPRATERRGTPVQTIDRANQDVQLDSSPVFTRKDEAVAIALANVLPGAGQFYAGKYVKGSVLLGLTALSAANVLTCDDASSIGGCYPEMGLFVVVSLGTWAVGMFTAAGDAREYNEKHARPAAVRPVVDRRAGRTGLGLALRY